MAHGCSRIYPSADAWQQPRLIPPVSPTLTRAKSLQSTWQHDRGSRAQSTSPQRDRAPVRCQSSSTTFWQSAPADTQRLDSSRCRCTVAVLPTLLWRRDKALGTCCSMLSPNRNLCALQLLGGGFWRSQIHRWASMVKGGILCVDHGSHQHCGDNPQAPWRYSLQVGCQTHVHVPKNVRDRSGETPANSQQQRASLCHLQVQPCSAATCLSTRRSQMPDHASASNPCHVSIVNV